MPPQKTTAVTAIGLTAILTLTGAAQSNTTPETTQEPSQTEPAATAGTETSAADDVTYGATLLEDHQATLQDGNTTTLTAGTYVVVIDEEAGELHTAQGPATVETLHAEAVEDASELYRRDASLTDQPGGGEEVGGLAAGDNVVEIDRYGRYSKVAAGTNIGWVDTKYIGDGWALPNHLTRAVTVAEDTPVYGTPSTEAGTAGSLTPGQSYAATKANDDGTWLRVHLEHGWAWVPEDAVTDADVDHLEVDRKVEIEEEGRPITTLHPSQSYPILDEEDGSYLLNTEGTVAWYTPEEQATEPEPEPEPTEPAPDPEPEPEPTPTEPDPDPEPEPSKPVGTFYTTGDVNLRAGPGTSNDKIATIPANTEVPYYATRSGWAHVETDYGDGWISLNYLSDSQQYPFAVYGTLRTGQAADFVIDPLTVATEDVDIVDHQLWQHPSELWLTFIVPGNGEVVAERKTIAKDSYAQAVADIDAWERYNPNEPKEDQIYNRELVQDQDGRDAWAYVAGEKQQQYITNTGTLIPSGDYTRR